MFVAIQNVSIISLNAYANKANIADSLLKKSSVSVLKFYNLNGAYAQDVNIPSFI